MMPGGLASRIDADPVAPGLFIGSAPEPGYYRWLHVLVLCAREYQPPQRSFPGLTVIRVPFDDDPGTELSKREIRKVVSGGRTVGRYLASGQRVLVTCQMGWNRSALIAGIAMRDVWGADSVQIIERLRAARGEQALSNPQFEALLLRY